LGARQVGKTTLAREFVARDSINYFDLEDPVVANIMENPMTALQPLKGLVVIDEATDGAKSSFKAFWKETWRDWASGCPRWPCGVSGR